MLINTCDLWLKPMEDARNKEQYKKFTLVFSTLKTTGKNNGCKLWQNMSEIKHGETFDFYGQ